MQPSNFDELTKALAASTSRRHALKLIATASIGGLFGLGGISTAFGRHHRRTTDGNRPGGQKGNSNCAKWCAQVFGPNTPAAGQCTSDAAHGRGLCSTCGNVAPSSICCVRNTSGYCNGTAGAQCCNSSQCETCSSGTCVSACSSSQTCCSGTCKQCCADSDCSGQHCCNGTCAQCCDDSDCTTPGQTCQSGTCVCTPDCTGKMCGDDNGCGGSCTNCPSDQICCKGECCLSGETCTDQAGCCPAGRECGARCCTSDQTCCQDRVCCNPDRFCCGDRGFCCLSATQFCSELGRCVDF